MGVFDRTLLARCCWAAYVVLAGCTVGPDYNGPPQVVAAGRGFVRSASVATDTSVADSKWWTVLHDPTLNTLEAAALAANPGLAAAAARLRQSRAQLRSKQAELRPSTSTSAVYLHTHGGEGLLSGLAGGSAAADSSSAGASSGSSGSDFDLYDVGFDATWEIDLFGGRRRAVEGAAAGSEARVASLADAQVSLTADVARAYVSLRDFQHRTALSQASAALQGRTLALTRQRAAGGTASALDVERLNSQVEQTQADLVPLQAQIEQQLNQLAILTGRAPGDLDAMLTPVAPIPLPPPSVSIGDPATLLRRRPDIRVAERQIAAENATIGQHVADYFPKLEVLGNLGFSSTDVGQLLNGGSFSAVVAPVLSWKPFDFGRTAAAVDQARASRDEAVANYRGTVLKALEDAETALSRYGNQRQSVVSLQRVLASASRAAALSRQRYVGGTSTLIDTLDAERQRYAAEQAEAQAQAELTEDFIGLQKSLGLGWQAPAMASTSFARD